MQIVCLRISARQGCGHAAAIAAAAQPAAPRNPHDSGMTGLNAELERLQEPERELEPEPEPEPKFRV